MTLKIPNIIRVGSTDYTVEYSKGLASGATLLGEINYGQCTIKIDDSLPASRAREVLAHELVHALLLEAGYDDHEEEQAIRVGTILAMLLRDNDFAFMKEDE